MSAILDEFIQQRDAGFYTKMTEDILSIIEFGLNRRGDSLHTKPIITHRVKDKESLIKKIAKKNKYGTLSDIVGIRIIAYFQDDVNFIKKALSDVFWVDKHNSIDKRNQIGNSFGYASLHLIASASRPYGFKGKLHQESYLGTKFEIQIRTILEHAWAEIEHDFGYKSELKAGLSIPTKRGLSRLAAMLETVDAEFNRLRIDMERHISKVQETSIIENSLASITIVGGEAPYPIWVFFQNSPLVRRIEDEILNHTQRFRSNLPPDWNHNCTYIFNRANINTIQELHDFIAIHENDIIALAITNTFSTLGEVLGGKSYPYSTNSFIPSSFLLDWVCLYTNNI